jgi:hypothetical protein
VHDVTETLRLPSPAPRPQALAFDGDKLWMGSIETDRLYAINPLQWTVIEEEKVPGKPWGMAVLGDELRVICGVGDEDDRVIRRYVSQWYNRRILGLDERGNVVRQIDVPHGICGQCYVDGYFYLVTTEDEESEAYFLTKVSANGGNASEDLARIPFAARALAFDGSRFWTNHRDANQIVAFDR